ncbi:hypothetical protein DFH27DRAFT_655078 [Peziza echinospora]|nr:hypothetical protein DFH27DRAFT_655078 [Peziza echinospora]
MSEAPKPLRVAIVGSGAAGLSALWTLRQTPSKYDIHLFEADGYIGGHTNTIPFRSADGKYETMVDTGFIVCNEATYPNFLSFLKCIGITPAPTAMTFSISRDSGLFEWAGTNLFTVFAQGKNLLNPAMWRMLFDVIRFNHFASDILENEIPEGEEEESIGEYLERESYSESFKNNYLIPMTAAIWSTSPDKCALQFPAMTLVQFLKNHHLLNTITTRPKWLTILGGSIQYIQKILHDFPTSNIHLNTPIYSLSTTQTGTVLLNGTHEFDHVILATHGDQALQILGNAATREERDILQHFKCSENIAVLHSDLSLMPKRRMAWAAWNYITLSDSTSSRSSSIPSSDLSPTNIPQVCLTYNMNILQHLPPQLYGDILVTLNPLHRPSSDATSTYKTFNYSHPLYTPQAVLAQKRLATIQGKRGISFCGAWTGYGFHEDAFRSGMQVAVENLGAELPFEWTDAVRHGRERRGEVERERKDVLVMMKGNEEDEVRDVGWN